MYTAYSRINQTTLSLKVVLRKLTLSISFLQDVSWVCSNCNTPLFPGCSKSSSTTGCRGGKLPHARVWGCGFASLYASFYQGNHGVVYRSLSQSFKISFRWRTSPTGTPHATVSDDVYNAHFILKGRTGYANIYWVNMCPGDISANW